MMIRPIVSGNRTEWKRASLDEEEPSCIRHLALTRKTEGRLHVTSSCLDSPSLSTLSGNVLLPRVPREPQAVHRSSLEPSPIGCFRRPMVAVRPHRHTSTACRASDGLEESRTLMASSCYRQSPDVRDQRNKRTSSRKWPRSAVAGRVRNRSIPTTLTPRDCAISAISLPVGIRIRKYDA